MRLLLSRVLERAGHSVVRAAADGVEAWEAFQTARSPLLILDWEMPRLDGLELCRRIRASDRGDEPFILVVTARDRTEDLAAVLDAGADDYMAKPVTADNLQARLRIAERRIEVSAARRQAEGHVGDPENRLALGKALLDRAHALDRLPRAPAREDDPVRVVEDDDGLPALLDDHPSPYRVRVHNTAF